MFYFFNKLTEGWYLSEEYCKYGSIWDKYYTVSAKYPNSEFKVNQVKLKCGAEPLSLDVEQWSIVCYLNWIIQKCTHHGAISIQSPFVSCSPVALTTFRICEGNKESVDSKQFAPQSGANQSAGGRLGAMSGRLTYSSVKTNKPKHQLLSALYFIALSQIWEGL